MLSTDNKYDLSLKLYLKNYVEVQIISRVIVGRSSGVYLCNAQCALYSRKQERALTQPAVDYVASAVKAPVCTVGSAHNVQHPTFAFAYWPDIEEVECSYGAV